MFVVNLYTIFLDCETPCTCTCTCNRENVHFKFSFTSPLLHFICQLLEAFEAALIHHHNGCAVALLKSSTRKVRECLRQCTHVYVFMGILTEDNIILNFINYDSLLYILNSNCTCTCTCTCTCLKKKVII